MSWPKVKIGDLVEPISKWSPKKNPAAPSFTYIDLSSIDKEKKLIREVTIVHPSEAPSRARQLVQENDVLVSTVRPNLNGVAMIGPEYDGATASTGYCVLRPNPEKILPSFLFHWVKTPHFISEMTRNSTGANYPAVSDKTVKEYLISLPPLEEQKRIATILDKANEIKNKSKSIQKIRNKFIQSTFVSMFGEPGSNPKCWEKIPLTQLCSFEQISVKPENIVNGTHYLGLECIEKETGNILDVINVENGELKSNKFWFDETYILYGKLRPYLNKVALPHFEGVCSTDIIPIQPKLAETNREFISYILKSEFFVSFANQKSSGANLPRISPKKVQNFLTIKPPISLQNQFAEIVKLVKKIPDSTDLSSTNLDSITQEMLT